MDFSDRSDAVDRDDWIKQLFQSIDSRDADAFVAFLSDDVFFQFGNAAVPAKNPIRP